MRFEINHPEHGKIEIEITLYLPEIKDHGEPMEIEYICDPDVKLNDLWVEGQYIDAMKEMAKSEFVPEPESPFGNW